MVQSGKKRETIEMPSPRSCVLVPVLARRLPRSAVLRRPLPTALRDKDGDHMASTGSARRTPKAV